MIQNSPQNQENQEDQMLNQEDQPTDESTRDRQKQVPKRVGQNGSPMAGPRLAQKQRPQSPSMGGGVANQVAKSAFSKYLPYMIVGGSIGGAAVITDFFYKLIS